MRSLENQTTRFKIQRALDQKCHGIRLHVNEPSDFKGQDVVVLVGGHTHVSTVLSAGYNDSAVSDAQKYARVLAKLAGLDAREGGVSNTLEVLKAQLQGSSLSAAGQSLLVDGAAIFESGSNATLSNLIASGAVLGDASTANVGATIGVRNAGELADNALSAVEAADGTQIVVAIASNAVSADTVSVRVSGTGVGVEQTTVSQVLSAADVTRGYVSVALSQGLLDASGEGQKVVSAIFRNGSSEKTVAVTGFSYDPSTTTVQGTVALGPVSSGHGLKVTLYRADGSVLVSESSVGADGTFSLGFSASYKGLVLARVRDTSAGADYQDEVSGLKDLNTDLRAVFNVSGPGVVEVSITPLSELATRVLLNDTGGDGSAGYTVGANQLASAVAAINSSVSNAFGVSDVLTHVSTVLSAGYNDSAVSDAQKYARVLAKLAGLDAREGGVSNTLEVLKAQLQGSSLSAAGQSLLVDGAAIFESGSNATLSNLIASGAVLGDASTANVGATIGVRNAGELADNALSAVEAADGTQIVVAIASNAVSADTVSVRVSGTGVGVEQTTVSQVLSAADVTRG